jgi:hypothetical protein
MSETASPEQDTPVGAYAFDETGWRLEVYDFAKVSSALGADVMQAFARCFVHNDRLVSLTHLGALSAQSFPQASVTHTRNLYTMLWFVVGTLRELAVALRGLRSALAKQGFRDFAREPWLSLRGIETRWEDSELYRKLRDRVGFHVDDDVIAAGLQRVTAQSTVLIARGDSKREHQTSLCLGIDSLMLGLGFEEPQAKELFRVVSEDQRVSLQLEAAFKEMLASVTTRTPRDQL